MPDPPIRSEWSRADVLFLLDVRGELTTGEIADALGTGVPAAYRRLDRMADDGLVARRGGRDTTDGSTYWRVG